MPLRKKKNISFRKIAIIAIIVVVLVLMLISFPAPETVTEVVLS
jgi:uncharacterized membrane protein YvbJ